MDYHNETHPEFKFIECLRDNFLSREIMNPTRYRIGQMANIFDLLLVDKREIVNDIQFSSGLGASDHLAYSAYLRCNPEIRDSETLKYNFHKGDYVTINKELQSVDWGQLHNMNVQERWDFFQEKLQSSIENHIPIKRKSKKKQKWTDKKCLDAVKKKHRAWNKYIHTQSQRNYSEYCKVRNACTKTTRSAKKKRLMRKILL